jgi:photosystem II stability/assembly factor-like uncharacterized protein
VDGQTGWAVGLGGTIVYTSNGGMTWASQTINANDLVSVSFSDAQTGWAVGLGGTIVHTTDGTTWAAQRSGTAKGLLGVSFVRVPIPEPDTATLLAIGLACLVLGGLRRCTTPAAR